MAATPSAGIHPAVSPAEPARARAGPLDAISRSRPAIRKGRPACPYAAVAAANARHVAAIEAALWLSPQRLAGRWGTSRQSRALPRLRVGFYVPGDELRHRQSAGEKRLRSGHSTQSRLLRRLALPRWTGRAGRALCRKESHGFWL